MNPQAGIGETRIEPREAPRIRVALHVAILGPDGPLLDDRHLTVISIDGEERVSTPFTFHLELHGDDTHDSGVPAHAFDDLVGRTATIGIDRPREPGTGVFDDDAEMQRFDHAVRGAPPGPGLCVFNGIVSAFSMAAPGTYRMTLRPALWKTTLTNRYCLYPERSIRDVIRAVLERHGIPHDLDRLSAPDNPANARVQDWLQAGESDYELLTRLMRKEHVYYYFRHDGTTHTVVFANDAHHPEAFDDPERVLRYTYTDEPGLQQADQLREYEYGRSLTTSGTRTTVVRNREAWEDGRVLPFSTHHAGPVGDGGDCPCHVYRVHPYGGSQAAAERYNRDEWQSLRASATRLSGASLCAELRAAHAFRLGDGGPVRPTLAGRRFVALSVHHRAGADGHYDNRFEAVEAPALIAEFSLHNTEQGSILAEVTGVGEPPADWRFYTRSAFDPDTQGFVDRLAEPPEHWAPRGVRVRLATDAGPEAEAWVKLSPQMQSVPEVGAIVQVGRARDTSEAPEIQAIVQANGSRAATPTGWTAHTAVGSQYEARYGDAVSIGFGRNSRADLERARRLVLDAYEHRRPSVGPAGTGFSQASYRQGGSYSFATADDGRDGLLSAAESCGSTYSRHAGQTSESELDVDVQRSRSRVRRESVQESTVCDSYSRSTVEGDTHSESTVHGSVRNEASVLGVESTTRTVNVAQSTSTTGTRHTADAAGTSTSAASVGMQGMLNMVGVSGALSLIGANAQTSIVGASQAVSVTGASNQVSVTGTTSGLALTGASSQANLAGSVSSMNLMGAASQMNVVGTAANINVTGAAFNMNVLGALMDITVMGPGMRIMNRPTTLNIELGAEATRIHMPGLDLNMPVGMTMFL
jgi:type VI secretion system secreted protein VgrG